MFLETSAIIEILLDGPRSLDLLRRMHGSLEPRFTGPTVVYEATVVLAGKQDLEVANAERLVRALLVAMNVSVLDINDRTASLAIDAFARYGKGRHPAKLNFGDCFSYAGAKAENLSLLYVGNDFAQTDVLKS